MTSSVRREGRRRRWAVVAAVAGAALVGAAASASLLSVPLVQLSSDPYRNATSQHRTEVEPDTFAWGSTMVAAFQVGRFFDGGASNVGYATSTNAGASWTSGFLPETTTYASPPGPYARLSDPSVAYDEKHDVWVVSTLAFLEDPLRTVAVLASRSTDGGLTFEKPVVVATDSAPDKNWVTCDNTPSSPFYGNCYTEWDDARHGFRIKMSTSADGGVTWRRAKQTADHAGGIGGQPLVRRDGTVVVPINDRYQSSLLYFTSSDGGATWSATTTITAIPHHAEAARLRTPPLPSGEVDENGRVWVFWHDCRFRTACTANDIVYVTIRPDGTLGRVRRVPLDARTSGIDHFIPGITVDRNTGGASTHLALTYYYLPVSACGSSCELHVGFASSNDSGATWSRPVDLAGPMSPSWLALTSAGRMFGDYISTSFLGGSAWPGIIVANAPEGGALDEAAYTSASGLRDAGDTVAATDDEPVPGAASDHPPPSAPATAN
jgi:hypothetical protein